ncbi:MAG: guanylate kinase [Lachnospiraceae bacterium]|nr:guanylate kinase [Lachnospiraceae bacterium]
MGKIFCLMGKSSSGKDTIYKALTEDNELDLKQMISYTTRPIRSGETEGLQYHFVTEEQLSYLEEEGRIVELRSYNTVHGVWKYFTVCEEGMDLEADSYLVIGTLNSWHSMCAYYGRTRMVPVYIEVEDGVRLERALLRERSQRCPDYKEMCRRYLADCEDFTEEKLEAEGIIKRFHNTDIGSCFEEIKLFIQKEMRYN